MHCHCGTNNRVPRWTFTDPCKPEVRPGAREESASPAWLAAPAMNARDTTKVYTWRLDTGCGPTLYRKCHSHSTPGKRHNNTWVEPLAGNCTTSSTRQREQVWQKCKIQKNWCTVTVAPTIEYHYRYIDIFKKSYIIFIWWKVTNIDLLYTFSCRRLAGIQIHIYNYMSQEHSHSFVHSHGCSVGTRRCLELVRHYTCISNLNMKVKLK